ncbi:MAG: response regulator transcription factor [Candidatus Sedimenticola sp. 20ELBAFRAG]
MDKYLVVDDDEMIRNRLVHYLEKYGIECTQASDAKEAREILGENDFDLITLDILMPGESGLELIKWIKTEKRIPVILLSSLDQTVDTIIGLELGADDYIGKPFDPRELLARTKAVLRRYRDGDAEESGDKSQFNERERLLHIDGVDHMLSPIEGAFMRLMLTEEGAAVSRDTFCEVIFQKRWHPDDRSVDNIIARLRQKIEEHPQTPKYIVTVRNKGYMVPGGLIKMV